jgi:hypothetical protein
MDDYRAEQLISVLERIAVSLESIDKNFDAVVDDFVIVVNATINE